MILWGLDCTNLANKSRERNLKPYTWSPSHVEINFIIILCWWEFNWSSSQVRVNNLDQWSSYTTSQYCKSRFLKLMLGVAVTCSNKQTFIDKIQVTACVAVNIDGWHEDDNCDLPKKYRLPSKWEIKHFSPWTRQHNTLSLLALPLSSTQRWATGPNKIKIKSILQGWTCKQDQNYDISLSLLCRSGQGGSQHRAWTLSWRWRPHQATRSGLKSVTSSTSRWDLYECSIFCPHHHHHHHHQIIIVFILLLLMIMITGGSPQGGAVQPACRERGSLWEGARRPDTLEKGST